MSRTLTSGTSTPMSSAIVAARSAANQQPRAAAKTAHVCRARPWVWSAARAHIASPTRSPRTWENEPRTGVAAAFGARRAVIPSAVRATAAVHARGVVSGRPVRIPGPSDRAGPVLRNRAVRRRGGRLRACGSRSTTGPGRIELEERPDPVAGPGELVVRVRACGLCGSDLMAWYQDPRAPVVLGHEPAGEVVAAGAGAPFAVGDARLRAPPRALHRPARSAAPGAHTLCDTFRAHPHRPRRPGRAASGCPAENARADVLRAARRPADWAATLHRAARLRGARAALGGGRPGLARRGRGRRRDGPAGGGGRAGRRRRARWWPSSRAPTAGRWPATPARPRSPSAEPARRARRARRRAGRPGVRLHLRPAGHRRRAPPGRRRPGWSSSSPRRRRAGWCRSTSARSSSAR